MEDNSASVINNQEIFVRTQIGTNLQLVDQDDDDYNSTQSPTAPQVASEEPPSRRYPARERRTPA